MKHVILVVVGFLLVSCSPTIQQIKTYEFARQLNGETLYVPLRDETQKIALLEEYGETKKAKRLEEEVDKENRRLENAVRRQYNFSDVEFIPRPQLSQNQFHLEIVIEKASHDDRNNYLVKAAVRNASFSPAQSVEVDRITNFAGPNIDFMMKQLNSKLHKLNKNAR